MKKSVILILFLIILVVPFVLAVDSDNDGLDDDTEMSLGTDPFNTDTDNDGMSDGEEVNKLNTNPLVSDIPRLEKENRISLVFYLVFGSVLIITFFVWLIALKISKDSVKQTIDQAIHNPFVHALTYLCISMIITLFVIKVHISSFMGINSFPEAVESLLFMLPTYVFGPLLGFIITFIIIKKLLRKNKLAVFHSLWFIPITSLFIYLVFLFWVNSFSSDPYGGWAFVFFIVQTKIMIFYYIFPALIYLIFYSILTRIFLLKKETLNASDLDKETPEKL